MMAISILQVGLCVEHLPPIFQMVKLSQPPGGLRHLARASLLSFLLQSLERVSSSPRFPSPPPSWAESGRSWDWLRGSPQLSWLSHSWVIADHRAGALREAGGDFPIGNISRASAPGNPTPLVLKCVV